MERTKLLQQPDNDKIDLRNIIKGKKRGGGYLSELFQSDYLN